MTACRLYARTRIPISPCGVREGETFSWSEILERINRESRSYVTGLSRPLDCSINGHNCSLIMQHNCSINGHNCSINGHNYRVVSVRGHFISSPVRESFVSKEGMWPPSSTFSDSPTPLGVKRKRHCLHGCVGVCDHPSPSPTWGDRPTHTYGHVPCHKRKHIRSYGHAHMCTQTSTHKSTWKHTHDTRARAHTPHT